MCWRSWLNLTCVKVGESEDNPRPAMVGGWLDPEDDGGHWLSRTMRARTRLSEENRDRSLVRPFSRFPRERRLAVRDPAIEGCDPPELVVLVWDLRLDWVCEVMVDWDGRDVLGWDNVDRVQPSDSLDELTSNTLEPSFEPLDLTVP